MTTRTRVAPKSHLSTPTRFAIPLLCVLPFGKSAASEDEVLEDLPALLIVFKLIEAGAGGREQNDFAGLRGVGCFGYGRVERAGINDGRRSFDMSDDLFGGRADGVDGPDALLNERAHEAVVGVLVLAAENQVDTGWEGRDGFHGGIDVRGFGVVVVVDTVDVGHEFKPVFYGAKALDSNADLIGRDSGETGSADGGEDVFDIVLAFERDGGCLEDEFGRRLFGSAEINCAVVDEGSLAHNAFAAEPEDTRLGADGGTRGHIVVGIKDENIVGGLVGEDALLGSDVILKAAMAIEVIGRDVEDDGNVGMELRSGFKLEAGDLEHRPAV